MEGVGNRVDRTNVYHTLHHHLPYMVQIFRRLQWRDPEDAAHDVYCRLLGDVLVKGLIIDHAPTYLAETCRNYVYRGGRHPEYQLPEHVDLATGPPNYDLVLDLRAALGRLTERGRKLLLSGEESREQIALEHNKSKVSVTKEISRVRERLRNMLGYERIRKKVARARNG